MRAFSLLVAATSLVSRVAANLYVTKPIATDQCSATLECGVNWRDDGTTPSLDQIGVVSVDLCMGGTTQQTCLQNIAGAYDVSSNNTLTFRPDPKIGPTGQFYFLKFTSATLKSTTNSAQLFTAFSAKFTLVGMMGEYNASIINGDVGLPATTPTIPATMSRPVQTGASSARTTPAVNTDVMTNSGSSLVPTSTPNGASVVTIKGALPALAGVTVAAGFASIYIGMLILGL